MGPQNIAIWIAILPAIMIAAAPMLMAHRDKDRRKALDDYARKVNLAITPEVRPRVISRIKAYEKAILIGGGIGLVIGAIAAFVLRGFGDGPDAPNSALVLVPACIILGISYAPVVVGVRHTLRTAPGRRIARPTTPELSDYIPTLERISGPIGIAGFGVILVGGVIGFSTGLIAGGAQAGTALFTSFGSILGYLAVLTWLVGLWLQRRLLDTGQAAATEQELAWDDALRSMTLRNLAILPFVVSILATMIIFFQHARYAADTSPVIVGLVGLACAGYVAMMALGITLDAIRRPARHYWNRLWQRNGQPA